MNKYVRDLVTLPGDAALAWRLSGPKGVWREVADRSLRRVFRRARLVVVEQELNRVVEPAPPPGTDIRPIADPSALAPIAGRRMIDAFDGYLERGVAGFAAWRDGEPLGYTWLARRIIPGLLTVPLELPEDACYGFGLFVAPTARRGGVGSALVGRRLACGRRWGYRASWRAILVRNAPAHRTMEKTAGQGTRIVGEYRYWKVGPRFFGRFTPDTRTVAGGSDLDVTRGGHRRV